MHLKAIKIKEELLGPSDSEVGLSIGHLASLYNFHMSRYADAEKLYIRSLDISTCIPSKFDFVNIILLKREEERKI